VKYLVVTHTDIDGVAAAALYSYLVGAKPVKVLYTEPYLLDRALRKLRSITGLHRIVFTDLGLNNNVVEAVAETVALLTSKGISVEWYDHHIWNDDWIAKLKKSGSRIYIDRTTCATGVVALYAPKEREEVNQEFIEELVRGVCSGDLFRFDHWKGPWYIRVVRRHDESSWRNFVFEKLSSGTAWCREFAERVVERFEKELAGYRSVDEYISIREADGLKLAVVLQHDTVENSFLASYIMARYGVDVVAITSLDGKISLRSKKYNVRELAVALGGGGHARASGAKVHIPLSTRLKQVINKRAVVEYIAKVILDKADLITEVERTTRSH